MSLDDTDEPADERGESAQRSRDLAAWARESREMLDGLLTGRGINHAWQGTDLMTAADDEVAVAGLVDEVESAAIGVFGDEIERVAYEVGEWPVQTQSDLAHRLAEAGIAHEWDERGDLVVAEADEERVEAILDEIELPETQADSDDDREREAMPEPMTVLSELFYAVDRLRRNSSDPDGLLGLVEWSDVAERLPLPFGFEPAIWRDLVEQCTELRAAIEADDVEDEDITERATSLHRQLRTVV